MRWWHGALGGFLGLGLLVATISLYEAAVDNTLNKLGLVGGDFQTAVKNEEMTEWENEVKTGWECGLMRRMEGATKLVLAGEAKRGELAFDLAEQRVRCGAGMMSSKRVEEGTYEVMKGLGYLEEGYQWIGEKARVQPQACASLPDSRVIKVMRKLLPSTKGKVYDLLSEEWKRITELRKEIEAMCVDSE